MSVTTHQPLNGVDVPTLFATLDAVKAQNDIAAFQFRASNTWVGGTHSRTTYSGFFGAGQEMQHKHETVVEADHPEVLVGSDHAPTAAEYLLHAIAACLTSGIANIAAVRGVELTKVTFDIEGDADDETLRRIVEQSRRRSAVYDALTNPTPVVIDVVTSSS